MWLAVHLLVLLVLISFYKEFITYYSLAVPSSPPSSFSLTAISSTSITASWQLPPADSQNGIITGFKLFYKKKDSEGSATLVAINSGGTLTKNVTGLDKYTEYEFEVLASTSVGVGPKSSTKVKRTLQDGKICNMCTVHACKSVYLRSCSYR